MNTGAKLSIILLIASNFILSGIANAKPIDLAQIRLRKGIDLAKVAIGGIKLKMLEREVLHRLGNPRKRVVTRNCLGPIDRLHYPGLAIDLEQKGDQKYVAWIEATNSRYGTNRGVRVGDSIDKAVAAYSSAAHVSPDNTVTVPSDKYGDLFLVFESKNRRKITKISIVFEC